MHNIKKTTSFQIIILLLLLYFSVQTTKDNSYISLEEFKGMIIGMFSEENTNSNLIYDEEVINTYIKMMKVPEKILLKDIDKYINYDKIKEAILETVKKQYIDADISEISKKIDKEMEKMIEYSVDKEVKGTSTMKEYEKSKMKEEINAINDKENNHKNINVQEQKRKNLERNSDL